MCQIPITMVKKHAVPNSSLHNLKIYSSQGCRKISQSQSNQSNTEHSNSKCSDFKQMITSDYGFLLRLVNTFTIDTDKYYPMCYRVNMMPMPRTLKTLCCMVAMVLFYALCSQIITSHMYGILQIGSFNWGLENYIDLVPCITG